MQRTFCNAAAKNWIETVRAAPFWKHRSLILIVARGIPSDASSQNSLRANDANSDVLITPSAEWLLTNSAVC
eukprot:8737485-Pyramimonas_sp.AAC.2